MSALDQSEHKLAQLREEVCVCLCVCVCVCAGGVVRFLLCLRVCVGGFDLCLCYFSVSVCVCL